MTPPLSESQPGRLELETSRSSDGGGGEMCAALEATEALASGAVLEDRLRQALLVLDRRLGIVRSVVCAVNTRHRRLEIVAWHGLGPALSATLRRWGRGPCSAQQNSSSWCLECGSTPWP